MGAGVQLHGNVQSRCLDEQRKLRYERCPESPPTIPPQRSWQNEVVTKRAGDQSETWDLANSVRIMEWALRCVLLEVGTIEEMHFTARIHILGRE